MYLSEEYKQQLQQKHTEDNTWGSTGWQLAPAVLALAQGSRDILDYGSGKRSLERALGFSIQNYDPGIPELSELPKPAEVVACLDVMEHVEPEHVEAVVKHLAELTGKYLILLIHTGPAIAILPDGRNAHVCQRDIFWWFEKFSPYFDVYEVKKYGIQYILIMEPKCHAE